MREPILVTGAAGFIGFHLARRLLADGWTVHGVDNLNDYYDPRLKEARLGELRTSCEFPFRKMRSCRSLSRRGVVRQADASPMSRILRRRPASPIRPSIPRPMSMPTWSALPISSKAAATAQCRHLVYASSSSVYGANQRMPLRVSDRVDEPLSLYGATKRANELMAYSYAHLFGLPATGLRFFTVYGPWGRPDMAVWLFTQAILEDRPVRLYNHGHMRRDFTYVDDVIEAVVRLIEAPPAVTTADAAAPTSPQPPHRLYNVGNEQPIEVTALLDSLEKVIGKPARRELLPMRPIDVLETFADSSELRRATGFAPRTPIEDGLRAFVTWYRGYRGNT